MAIREVEDRCIHCDARDHKSKDHVFIDPCLRDHKSDGRPTIGEDVPTIERRRHDNEVHELKGLSSLHSDMLKAMIEFQERFMKQIGVTSLPPIQSGFMPSQHPLVEELTKQSVVCTTALSCEITEFLDAIPWKPWKKSYGNIDMMNLRIEIVDMLMFVLELALIWGMDAEALYKLFARKMEENFDRQSKGY